MIPKFLATSNDLLAGGNVSVSVSCQGQHNSVVTATSRLGQSDLNSDVIISVRLIFYILLMVKKIGVYSRVTLIRSRCITEVTLI